MVSDRQINPPGPSPCISCWSVTRLSIECTATPAKAGSSLGLPARKRALSALTTSAAPSEDLELHGVEATKRSHVRIFLALTRL